MKEKEERLAQERSMKQACRFRLIADKGISVASIQSVLSDYLRYKKTNDLWCLVAPPATGPQTFGWHTYPSADWLCKTASLLYDLVGLAPNTKLQSTKLVKCLRAMYDHKELHVDIKKGTTIDDSFDKLDLTIRVLLNMIRTLKCNEFQRLKVQRSLTRQDWSKLEFVLDRVQLPAELMAASSQDEIEEEDVSRLRTVSVLNELPAASDSASADVSSFALVPCPVKSQQKQMGAAHGSLKPLPSVFQKHFAASEISHEEKPVPVECSKVTSASSKKTKLMEKILNLTNPVLDELKSTYQRHESKEGHKALTKTLFCGKFNLSEDSFQAGLAAGEFHEVIGKDGTLRYSWEVLEHTVAKGRDSKVTLKSETYLSKKDAAFEKTRLDGPFIGLFQKNQGQLAIASPAGQLALCDKEIELTPELWTQAQSQLSAATKFWENNLKEAKKLLQQVGVDNRDDDLYQEKDITQKIQKEKAILDHIWQWKETPENSGKPLTVKNYDDCMLASGKAGEALELRLAGAKGQANAIAARQRKAMEG
ncbi:unnamed protein product [Cladocopium goreaui]|uniref:Uncharacterized protein n=1 Tax=Cladocopium goreaui TaxID=2562237 RepID=A0A9P1C8P1_9DINO|nr:unnamed protein product [Cladocopium goreaui]